MLGGEHPRNFLTLKYCWLGSRFSHKRRLEVFALLLTVQFGKNACSITSQGPRRALLVSDLVVIAVTMPINDCLKERATCSEG